MPHSFHAPTSSPYSTLGRELRGRLDEHTFTSSALAGNLVGDPAERPVWVSTPAGWDGATPLPVVYVLQGYTGHLSMWHNRTAFRPTPVERVDALLERVPVLVVWVDGWTCVGGSQFVDSPVLGRWATYVCDEVTAFVDAHYPTVAGPGGRAVTGKSSGGYGAMRLALDRPDVFGSLATHAGDALFETCYLPELPAFVRAFRQAGYGSLEELRADLDGRVVGTKETDFTLIEFTGYACAYSSHEDGTVDLPVDLETGELVDEVWQRWLAHDPVRIARTEDGQRALSQLRGAWVDAGTRDPYFLDLGAEAFRRECERAGARTRFETFDATHAAIEYRYPLAIEWLATEVLDQG